MIRPVRLHFPEGHGDTTSSRIVGYRGACSCGWRSSTRNGYREAREAAHDHRREPA